MCGKCDEIDVKIVRYSRSASSITDQQTIDGAKRLVADLQKRKAALHPERKE